MTIYRWMGAAAMAAALAGCTEEPAEMPGPQDGAALYRQTCADCHGADARGGGPLAQEMEISPKDLTRISERNGGAFPRARIMSIIDGYARSDMTGPGMPEFGALLEGDLVPFDSGDGIQTPTPRKLVALLEYLESVQAPEG